MRNSVSLIGYIGNDPKMTAFDAGSKKVQYSLATTSSYKNNKGDYVKDTQWHNIIAWGMLAENMNQLLSKGNQVAIQGSITYRNYKDAAGIERYITEIKAETFLKLDKSEGNKEFDSANIKKLEGAPLEF